MTDVKAGDKENKLIEDADVLISLVKQGKRSYIYRCGKDILIKIVNEEGLQCPQNPTVDALRKLLSDYYQNKGQSQPKILKHNIMTNYEIKPFNGDNWEVFEQQLESLILLNDVPEDKQVALLITKLTPNVFETLQILCKTKKPITLTYKELCDKLRDKYTLTKTPLLDRAEFRRRNQLPTETIEEYVLNLRKLSRKCHFKDEEDQIKEKLVDGVFSKLIKFELMKQSAQAKLEDLINLAKTVESAYKQANGEEETSNISYVKPNSRTPRQRCAPPKKNNTNNMKSKCFCCGKDNHIKNDCTLKTKFCSECGQQGHIFKMCPKKYRHTNVLDVAKEENKEDQGLEEEKKLYEEYETYTFDRVSRIPPHLIELTIGQGQKVQFEVDTGAEVSVMPLSYHKKYLKEYTMERSKAIFRNFDQSESQPLGIIRNIPVQYKNVYKELNIYVSHDSTPCLMGRDWLSQLNMWPPIFKSVAYCNPNTLVKNVSDAKQLIDQEFAAVFSPGWGAFKGEAISLKLKKDAVPKFLPVRRVPHALRDKVKHEIDRLQQNGRIVSVEQSQWGTPVVPIIKPDGSVRLCGDYKVTLNPNLEIDHYPLPHVEDIFETLKEGEYYCELDLREAYLQAALTEESQLLTTIVTEFGTYKYKYLPYGVNTGPESFQRLMCKKLIGIPNTIVFIDNIYVAGKSLQETYETLVKVLNRLQECNFKLKPEKCKLFTSHIDVFGFRINKEGMSLIKSNIEPLLNVPAPTNLTMLKSFLGKVNYYSRFLKDMAKILSPLYECTKINKFNWTADCQKSFDTIKNKLASANNLRHFNPDLPIIVTCDASNYGLAAVLSNRDQNGTVRPIAYASKKLNTTEQKYAAIDREAMGIVFAVTKFYNYIYGRQFELETDSSALVRIFGPTKGIPKMAAKRLQHYAIFLSAFNYKIKHIKTNNNPADYLSRNPDNKECPSQHVHPIFYVDNLMHVLYANSSDIGYLNFKIIQENTKKDQLLSKIIEYCRTGWPNKNLIKSELLPFYNRKTEISVDQGCLLWGHRVIIPETNQKAVLKSLHKTHFGIIRMKEVARSYFWWPNLNSEIENIGKSCLICLSNLKNPIKSPQSWPTPPTAWYRLHADFLGPYYNKMYLVIIDSYSKWPEAFEMSNMTAAKTIDVLDKLFSRFGYPDQLVTDNQTTFTSTEFNNYCKENSIKQIFAPPYHPATNGAAERFVQTFKSAVTKIRESGCSINTAINLFLFDYRTTPQRTTGETPARLLLGRELRNRFSCLKPPPIIESLSEREGREACKRKVKFVTGQKVMVRDYRKGHKPWIVGKIVSESVPDLTYIIEVQGMMWKRHIDQMVYCNEDVESN